MTENTSTICSVKDAAELVGLTTEALYIAIKKRKIKAFENENFRKICKWSVDLDEVMKYKEGMTSKKIQDASEGGKYLTVKEASKIAKVTQLSVYKAIRENKVEAKKIDRVWMIERDSILKYAKSARRKVIKPDIIY